MTDHSWDVLRDMVTPAIDALPVPVAMKDQFGKAMTDLVNEAEAQETKLDRVDAWYKANAYRAAPDWQGLGVILEPRA